MRADLAAAPVLEIGNLTVALPQGGDRAFAIEDVSLQICPGECLCLVGESGSGKSVTGQAILGMVPPPLLQTGGTISFDGAPLPSASSAAMQQLRGGRIGMISQEPMATLDPIMRVGAQLDELLNVHGFGGRAARRAHVLDLFAKVRLPEPDRIYRAYPHQLSGGQCQRVVIAMALALDPVLLIADEPTTALDVTTQAEILKLIEDLQRDTGAALLFITHDLGVVADIADHVLVMQEGRVVESGSRDALFADPQHPYTRRLIEALPKPPEGTPRHVHGEPVLEIRDLSLSYHIPAGPFKRREQEAVSDVSLTLRRGETHGVVGESGSGKSSLIKAILNLEPASGGTVTICGNRTRPGRNLPRDLRRRIQLVQQDPFSSLDPRQTVGGAISEAARIHGASARDARERTLELLERVDLPAAAYDRFPHEFSGGQRQRVCIVRALAVSPEILIADEAVSALDVSIQAQILRLFRDLQDEFGFAILFVTHDLRVAGAICDRITVMREGRVVEQGLTAEVIDRPQHAYTRCLIDSMPDPEDFALSGLHAAVVEPMETRR